MKRFSIIILCMGLIPMDSLNAQVKEAIDSVGYKSTIIKSIINQDIRQKHILSVEKTLKDERVYLEKPLLINKINFNSLLDTPPIYTIDNGLFYMQNETNSIPGITATNSVSAGYFMHLMNNWHINVRATTLMYRDFSGIYTDFPINVSSHAFISDRLGINAYGQYSINSIPNSEKGSIPNSPFAPNSYFGGSLEFRITEKLGVETGIGRHFNPWNRKWESFFFVFPKIYESKSIKIGIQSK